jgi:hypothetical protein
VTYMYVLVGTKHTMWGDATRIAGVAATRKELKSELARLNKNQRTRYIYYIERAPVLSSPDTVPNPELAALQSELARARAAFRQNPTPPLSSVIKQLEGKIKYQKSRAFDGLVTGRLK